MKDFSRKFDTLNIMNEAARNMTGFEDETARNPALGNAIRRAAQGIGGSENLTPESIKDLFRSKGIIGESQEKLGEEIGAIAGDEIVKNGGIINLMSSEKSPEGQPSSSRTPEEQKRVDEIVVQINLLEAQGRNDDVKKLDEELQKIYAGQKTPLPLETLSSSTKIPREGEGVEKNNTVAYIEQQGKQKSTENTTSISYRDSEGNAVPLRDPSYAEHKAESVQPEEALVGQKLSSGWSPLNDEVLTRIQQETEEENRKITTAAKQLRDHTKDHVELQNMINMADAQLEKLDRERENYIKEKIRGMPPEKIEALRAEARKEFLDTTITNRTVATAILKLADRHIKELEVVEKTGKAPETTPSHAETTQEVGPEKRSSQEELVRIELDRAPLIKKQREGGVLTTEEQTTLDALTNRMKILRGEISSIPKEEVVIPASETIPTESITPRGFQITPEAAAILQIVEEGGVPAFNHLDIERILAENGIVAGDNNTPDEIIRKLKEKRDGTVSVSSHAETTTVVPETQAEIISAKEESGNPFEKAIARIRSEDPKRAERLLATIGASQEQRERIEKFLGATQTQAQKIDQDIEKIKEKDPRAVEHLLKIGEWYRRLPFKYKLATSAVLVGGTSIAAAFGGAGVGMIMGAALVGSATQRVFGAAAVFTTVEGILTKRSLARNEEEKRIWGMRENVILGALAASGVFLGGKLLGDYLSTHSGGETGSGADEKITGQVKVPPATPEHIPRVETQNMHEAVQKEIHQAIPLPHEEMAGVSDSIMTPGNELVGHAATAEAVSSIMTPENEIVGHAADKIVEASYAVHSGDNLWNIIKEKIPEIQTLDGEGRQSNAIANIIEQIKKDPESFGITSGNVDTLSTGDTIDLEKVRGVLDTTKISVGGHEASIIERARGLTDIETSHIMENNAKISAWHTAHPDTLLTTETVDKILSGHDVSTTTGVEHSSTIDTAEKYANVRKDMESIEATSMKTTEILRADVQTMFGSKGFFGYGFLGTNGERSIDWLDLKGRTVDEVLSKKFVGVPAGEEGAVQKFGIDSFSAVDKMREYIYMLVEKAGAGTIPEPNESVEHFSKRAISVIISKK